VTIYHKENSDTYHRVVIHHASLSFCKNSSLNKGHSTENIGFLLIVPQGADGFTFLLPHAYSKLVDKKGYYTISKQDKILLGEGGEIDSAKDWGGLIPSNYDGLVVAQNIDIKYWQGKLCHIEVGGQ